jgi:hypothetical protein
MNFHIGKSMNCSMQLGLSDTTCPQRLQEQNPIKVVTSPLRLKPSRSCSCRSPLFLLVNVASTCIGTIAQKKLNVFVVDLGP